MDPLRRAFSPIRPVPLFLAALLAIAPVFPSFVEEGMTTLEAASDTASLHVGAERVIVAADFYSATSQWGNLFPRTGSISSKFEKNGALLTLFLGDTLSNRAVQRFTVRSNGARLELEATFAPSEVAKIAVWDLFLSRSLFAQATVKCPGAPNRVLDTNRWEAIFVDEVSLHTEAGDWRFVLTGDKGVKWKLRSVCDRKWGVPDKQTFDFLYQFEGIPPEGMKLSLTVDIEYVPEPGWLGILQKRADDRAADFFRGLGRRYGAPSKPETTQTAELAARAAKRSAELSEDRTDPRAPTLIPLPKKMAIGKGAFSFREHPTVLCAHEGAYSLLAEDLAARGLVLTRAAPGAKAAITLVLASEPASASLARARGLKLGDLAGKKEAYLLSVGTESILVLGADLAGLVHGVQSLRQLLRPSASGTEAPVVEISDSPDLAFRGFYLEGAGTIVGTEDFRRLLRNTYSRFHANAVMAELRWSQIQWKSHPEISGPKARPLTDLAAAAKEAESLGIEFIPAIFSYGKVSDILKSHPEIAEDPAWKKKGDAWCPNNEATYALFFDLLKEIVEATGCKRVHIGHDEIMGMALCPACKAVPADELFARDINRIADWLSAKRVGAMIWGDFLLENKRWVPLGVAAANSANPQYGNHIVHPAVGKIRKDVVICDWQYAVSREYPSFKHFADAGYPVIGCPWHLSANNTGTARAIGAIKQAGVLVTDWGFLGPRATGGVSILGVTHSWNLAQPDTETLAWDASAVLAASLLPQDRPSRRFGARQVPIDLGRAAQKALTGDPNAWFGLGTRHDLAWLPTGDQNFFGSQFRIGPKAVVIDAASKASPAIAVGRKAKSLVFLHALQVESLAIGARAYALYVLRRADGSVVNLQVNHRNAVHWFSKTPRKNPWGTFNYAHTWDALLAWEGATRSGESVNLQAWEWVNPLPEVPIVSVEAKLDPFDPGVQLGLVALTAVE
ncbi:MAG: beta-N-acetylhexosaminidase [Spirochaetes bacterium]|nr:beta-N-acetylhexosaminidase [Spirochaetota bacterium]